MIRTVSVLYLARFQPRAETYEYVVAKAPYLFDRSHESVESDSLERMDYHAILTRFDMITPEVAGRFELRALF